MVNAPVVLLYASGAEAERAVSPILVATVPERLEILPLAVVIFVSWIVFDPCTFWNACRRVSDERTTPEPATNPVSGDAMARALVK